MTIAILQGGPLTLFVNIPSVVIVFGGTIGATLVHYPFTDVFRAMAVGSKTVLNQSEPVAGLIARLLEYANKARKEGILSLESEMKDVQDPFLLKGLQLAVDGQGPEDLKEMLEREIEYIQERHENGADIFVAMGTYAPALGMIGTLIGLVQMLQTMNDPSTIGPAMAVALLTTLYGAIIANVVCIPMAGKLRVRSQSEVLHKSLVAEGLRLLLLGENPRLIEQKLHAFVAPKERKPKFD
jgi:chemotaxis protein MotA